MPVPEPLGRADTCDRARTAGRAVRAHGAAGMTASEIRALFAVASRPEVVSLAGGMPNIAALPLDALAGDVGRARRPRRPWRCSTAPAQGEPALREQICEVMALEGITGPPRRRRRHRRLAAGAGPGHPDLLRPRRRRALPRRPRYVGALGVFRAYQVRGRARRHGRPRARSRRRCGEALPTLRPAGDGPSSCTRSRTSTTRPA